MMKEKKYEAPVMDVCKLENKDIITASRGINKKIDPSKDDFEGDIIKFKFFRP